MFSFTRGRGLAGIAAVLFASGCAAGSVPAGNSAQSSTLAAAARAVSAGYRMYRGPEVAGPLFLPAAPPSLGPGYILPAAKKKPTLFVAWIDAGIVYLYDPSTPNPAPVGQITAGLKGPAGLAIDSAGTLYVANISNSTVTEYLAGQTSVHATISAGIDGPYGIAVDSKGNVFVSNLNNNTVTGYHAHKSTPFETIPQSAFGPNSQPLGLAADSHDNVWVASDSTNAVYEIPRGSSTPKNSGITGLSGPIGVAFGSKDTLYVSSFSSNVDGIYPSGKTSPTRTLTNGISAPTLNGLTAAGAFFQAEQIGYVEGYKAGASSPFSKIGYTGRPLGIASSPKLVP